MASARARGCNGGLGAQRAEPLIRKSGGEASQKLKALFGFTVSLGSIFAVFIRVSADKCMTLPESHITW